MRRWLMAASLLVAASGAHADQANCSGVLTRSNLANPVVEIRTTLGSVCIEVLQDQAPQTASNFLAYLRAGEIDGTFFHRAIPGFILQGGGFRVGASGDLIEDVPAAAPVMNEPCTLDQVIPNPPAAVPGQPPPPTHRCSVRGNVRGTLAMAKLGGQPDSATNQWFFNAADNRVNLDNQNEGFSVFARVLGNGMQVVDQILALAPLPYANYTLDIEPVSRLSAFNTLPVLDVPEEPAPGFGCFALDDLAVIFADQANVTSCPGRANMAGFTDDVCELGVVVGNSAEPSGVRVVSGACGTLLPRPEDFIPSASASGSCSEPDRFAWGVQERGDGQLVFAVVPNSEPPTKYPYALTCAQIAESDARLADRRQGMMPLTAPLLVYVEQAALSPEIVSPGPDATLGGLSQTFTWEAHDTQADAWAVWLGSTPGGRQYGMQVASDPGATALSFDGLPYQGQVVHATLWWRVNGQWSVTSSRQHVFHAATLPDPTLTSHANGDTFAGTSASFTWNDHGLPVEDHAIWFGTTAGGQQYGYAWAQQVEPGAAASVSSLDFDRLPYNGETVHVSFYWKVYGRWFMRAYTMHAADLPAPELISHADDATFTGTSATFTWDDNGVPVEDHAIWFGTTLGGRQHGYAWAQQLNPAAPHSVSSLDFTRLPYNGETVYVSFYWKVYGRWFMRAYTMHAANLPAPELISHAEDATFTGTSATFTWDDNGVPVEDHAVWFGTTRGGRQYGYAWAQPLNPTAPDLVSSLDFDRLPYNGEKVQVSFYWKVYGRWFKRDYAMNAADLPDPVLTSHANDSVFAGASATFTWNDHGLPVEDHAVWFGSTPGGRQYGYAWAQQENPQNPALISELSFSMLPVNGADVYVSFYWKVYGRWFKHDYTMRAASP